MSTATKEAPLASSAEPVALGLTRSVLAENPAEGTETMVKVTMVKGSVVISYPLDDPYKAKVEVQGIPDVDRAIEATLSYHRAFVARRDLLLTPETRAKKKEQELESAQKLLQLGLGRVVRAFRDHGHELPGVAPARVPIIYTKVPENKTTSSIAPLKLD